MSAARLGVQVADVTGLILAGGRSRRFGTDKALARLDGLPLVAHVHAALAPLCTEVLIATGPTARAYPVPARIVLDTVADGGPLAGLLAGLDAMATDWLLVVAADLPFVTSDELRSLVAGAGPSVDAVVAVDARGGRQPVCALYHRRVAAPARRQAARGQMALRPWLRTVEVREVALSAAALRNVNRPEDLSGG